MKTTTKQPLKVKVVTLKNLTPSRFSKLLEKKDACREAREWAEGKSLLEAWKRCDRSDWMFWLARRYGRIPKHAVVAIACDCAKPALKIIPKGETRPAEALKTVRAWLEGKATLDQVIQALDGVNDSNRDMSSWTAEYSASVAISKVCLAVFSPAYMSYADAAVGWAADAAAKSAGINHNDNSYDWIVGGKAEAASRRRSARVIRKYITVEDSL